MAFSKFDPDRPPEAGHPFGASTEAAGRRAMALRWATWITWGMTALGFGLLTYWTFR